MSWYSLLQGTSASVIHVDPDAHYRNRIIMTTLLPRESTSKVLIVKCVDLIIVTKYHGSFYIHASKMTLFLLENYWIRLSGVSRPPGLGPSEIDWYSSKTVLLQIYWSRTLNKSSLDSYYSYTRPTGIKLYCAYHYIFRITFSHLASA